MTKYYKAEDIQEIFSEENRPLNWTNTEREAQEQLNFDFYKSEIDNAPTIEAEEVRHGKWEMKPDPYGFFDEIPVCSVCGCTTEIRKTYAYCPHCGAKMEGAEHEID